MANCNVVIVYHRKNVLDSMIMFRSVCFNEMMMWQGAIRIVNHHVVVRLPMNCVAIHLLKWKSTRGLTLKTKLKIIRKHLSTKIVQKVCNGIAHNVVPFLKAPGNFVKIIVTV